MHRNCTICHKPIVLVPSAAERARKSGESPNFYLDLFRQHARCIVEKREAETVELLRKINNVTG